MTEPYDWRSESDAPEPARLSVVDDRLTADQALRRVRKGEYLLYEGDFRNARQLLTAMGRRVENARRAPTKTLVDAYRAERNARLLEHETLSKIVVALDPQYRLLNLKNAPDVAAACTPVWGPAKRQTVTPLKALIGMLGAAEWRRKGLAVPGLKGKLTPHYGVFLPTRTEYVELVLAAPSPLDKVVFDVGTGTGVLGFILLQRGAERVVATDVDPRAVACARENAEALKLTARFTVEERPLFPDGTADLVICNPPWIPEPPKNRLDRAVFDEGHQILEGFLSGLKAHLKPGGEGWLLMSDLPELLGLRAQGFLEERFAAHGVTVIRSSTASATHPKTKDAEDRLHSARSKEATRLWVLG